MASGRQDRPRRAVRLGGRGITFLALAALLAATPARAQFGQNKVQYHAFDWKILETQHFNIYYYSRERATALEAARMAERSYAYLSDFFGHEVSDKIPVVLYSNHQDFEQSNIIGGFISEGTGGVTESLKGRVTLPLTGSLAELNHVMTHELVHAFQFDLLKRNVRGLLGIGPLPLWMMEGMAEWVSNGMDPVTAMWVTDAVRRSKLPTVDKMASLQDIRVYRMGQALYEEFKMENGRTLNPDFVDYRMPLATEAPNIELVDIITDDPDGLYGAKEASEGSIVSTPPSIVSAIHDATGIWFTSQPVTPEKIVMALNAKKQQGLR